MLVMTRRPGEKVYIHGEAIKVIILHSTNGKVKLGFEASPDVPIFRQELYEREVAKQKPTRSSKKAKKTKKARQD